MLFMEIDDNPSYCRNPYAPPPPVILGVQYGSVHNQKLRGVQRATPPPPPPRAVYCSNSITKHAIKNTE